MDVGTAPARQRRTRQRHELRTLTYVTLDQANGGIIRNLSREGIGVQAVAAVRPLQEVRVRFELRYPRLRVEARGQVVWSTFSGQCGVRFVDLSPTTTREIQQWIFGNLLEGAAVHAEHPMFAAPVARESAHVEDGLLVSPTPIRVIDVPAADDSISDFVPEESSTGLDWLLQPLSGTRLAWALDTLALLAGFLLFALVFLSITHETPRWPVVVAAATLIPAMYWGFFRVFAGCSLGTRVARLTQPDEADEPADVRFR